MTVPEWTLPGGRRIVGPVGSGGDAAGDALPGGHGAGLASALVVAVLGAAGPSATSATPTSFYARLAAYGLFGPTDLDVPREREDRVEALKRAARRLG